jgi:carbohydrate-binding DOMON domain-containing protein
LRRGGSGSLRLRRRCGQRRRFGRIDAAAAGDESRADAGTVPYARTRTRTRTRTGTGTGTEPDTCAHACTVARPFVDPRAISRTRADPSAYTASGAHAHAGANPDSCSDAHTTSTSTSTTTTTSTSNPNAEPISTDRHHADQAAVASRGSLGGG